jgi:membrane protease YdiL (CAAX protease family)
MFRRLPRPVLLPAIQTAVYLLLYIVAVYLSVPLFEWTGGYLVGLTVGSLVASVFANSLSMAIFDNGKLTDVGFPWNRDAIRNGFIGISGGVGAALLVVGIPLLTGLASLVPVANPDSNWRVEMFLPVLLLCGSMGEELIFHGFGFQVLLRRFGTFSTILPVGALFGLLHASNPHASKLGIANTVGFGILFGFAFLRSHDLWLPIGLHFGWNFTLPMLGVNLSGITIKPTGLEIVWKAGPIWSGGDYGPEASVLTSLVLVFLAAYLWKAPICRQYAPVYEGPVSPELQPPS